MIFVEIGLFNDPVETIRTFGTLLLIGIVL
jgi:hypothetical protein